MASDETICIACGQPAGDPPKLNRLESGQPCRSCANRFLDAQPSLLPGAPVLDEDRDEVESWQQGPSGALDDDGGFDTAS